MSKIKKIHFVGVKGVGMTPLAIIAKEAGFLVTGSDLEETFITDKILEQKGIKAVPFSGENVTGVDLVITTGAHGGYENPEVKAARKLQIPVLTQGEAVAEFMTGAIFGKHFEAISVAGAHGKTTTSAMMATVLSEIGADPSYVIGTSNVSSLPGPGHLGKGRYFIAEADEYATEPNHNKKAKFLWQHPSYLIITNIDLDHPDIYPTLENLMEAYKQFLGNIKENGVLVINGDDKNSLELLKNYKGFSVTFGFSEKNDFVISKIATNNSQTFFWLESRGASLGEFCLNVIGEHNVLNATAVIAVLMELGFPVEKIKESLKSFRGSKRRSEYILTLPSGAMLFDDYAHHPTEIRKTIQAFKRAFPKHKVIPIFQPHTYSRTKKLFEQFSDSLQEADSVILMEIYPSAREAVDPSISSQMLLDKMNQFREKAILLPKLSDVVEYIDQSRFDSKSILITMGAGDVYKLKDLIVL